MRTSISKRAAAIGLACSSVLVATACSSSDPAPAQPGPTVSGPGSFDLSGVVRRQDGSMPTPVAGADVLARTDLDGDGVIGDTEGVKGTTDASGVYHLTMTVAKKQPVVLSIRAKDALPHIERTSAAPRTAQKIDATLHAAEPLVRVGTTLRLASSSLVINGLAPNLAGVAKAFSPIRDREAFPGDFSDDKSRELISTGFADVELHDEAGNPVHKLDKPATVLLELQAENWPQIRDVTPGNDQIDIPLYTYDELKGQWVQEGMGFVVDEAGATLPASALPSLLDGSFEGRVYSKYTVTHFSWVNSDSYKYLDSKLQGAMGASSSSSSPGGKKATSTSTGSCPKCGTWTNKSLAIKSETSTPEPASGAVIRVLVRGAKGEDLGYLNYAVEEDGTFAMDIPRSEGADEDLDFNGIKGEAVKLFILVDYDGQTFYIGEADPPTHAAKLDLGNIDLSTFLLEPKACTIHGTVVSPTGKPVADADVWWNSSDLETGGSACADTECTLITKSGADGSFTVVVPVALSVSLEGSRTFDAGDVGGTFAASGCPTAPVKIVLDGTLAGDPLTVDVTDTTISWTPTVGATAITVEDADGVLKWGVSPAPGGTIASPVTYGVSMAGEKATGTMAPLASGDWVTVRSRTPNADGFDVETYGATSAP